MSGSENEEYKVSVDGTDCPVQEPTPFSPTWYSHKFKSAGVRYEFGVSVKKGELVWVNGPFPAGSFPDLKIFRLGMKRFLLPGEHVIADGGYMDPVCSATLMDSATPEVKFVRARHEAANKRIKQFNVVSHRFRHRLSLHGYCFHACAIITQLLILDGEHIFE